MSRSDGDRQRQQDGLTRKQLLGTGASAAAAALLAQGTGVERALAAKKGGGRYVAGMNIVLILTDQERAIQHFPPNWLRQNLPGMRRLRQHGVSFERAFTNACMCSPARSTLMSGLFPAQHGVRYTLEEDMPFPEYPHRRDGPDPRRYAAEELQLLRGGDPGPARLLQPEAVPGAAGHRRARLPRRLPADPGQPREGAEIGPRQMADYDVSKKSPKPPQWEMYDLKTDPLEKKNLAYEGYERSEREEAQFQRLKRKLARVEKTRLQRR